MSFHRTVRGAAVVAAIAWLAGCATTVQLNYRTQPDGAQLYADGRYLGTGAGSVGARLSKDRWNAGQHCVVLPPVDAHWVSGAQVQAPPRRICLQSFTGGVVYRDALIVRPADVPGLRADLAYADQLVQQRLAERQVQAVEAAAAAAAAAARQRALEIRLHEHERHDDDRDRYDGRDRDHRDRDRNDRDRNDRERNDRERNDRDRNDRNRNDRNRNDRNRNDRERNDRERNDRERNDRERNDRERNDPERRGQAGHPASAPSGHRRPPAQPAQPSHKTERRDRADGADKARKPHKPAPADKPHPRRNPKLQERVEDERAGG